MKVIALLVIVGMVAVAHAIPEVLVDVPAEVSEMLQCPPPVEGGEAVNLPNCKDCTKFYSCVGTLPVLMNCPTGLHFNAIKGVCDWPQSACCDSRWDPKRKCKAYSGIC